MADDPEKLDHFKPAMPRIPGLTPEPEEPENAGQRPGWPPAAKLAAPLAAALILGAMIAWWMLRASRPSAAALSATAETPQELLPVPPPATPPPNPAPGAAEGLAEVATLQELAHPWSSKKFLFRKRLSGETVPAMVVRLPNAGAGRAASFWAFSLHAPFGRCELEYITDLSRLARQFGYRANHPMVADACNGTVYDPLRLGTLPDGSWARGDVVQGAGIRPPLAIDLLLQGHRLVATRLE